MFRSIWKSIAPKKLRSRLEMSVQNKEDYFDRVDYSRTVVGLRNALSGNRSTAYMVDEPILYKNMAFGASVREAKRLLGKPAFQLKENPEVVGHDVLFYFSSVGSVKVTDCLHFLHGEFIMVQSIVKKPNAHKLDAVLPAVAGKDLFYSEAREALDSGKTFSITDASANRLELQVAFDLTITYTTGNAGVIPLINRPLYREKTKKSFALENIASIFLRHV